MGRTGESWNQGPDPGSQDHLGCRRSLPTLSLSFPTGQPRTFAIEASLGSFRLVCSGITGAVFPWLWLSRDWGLQAALHHKGSDMPLAGTLGKSQPLLLPKTHRFHAPPAQHGGLGRGVHDRTRPDCRRPGPGVFTGTLAVRTEGVSSEPLSGLASGPSTFLRASPAPPRASGSTHSSPSWSLSGTQAVANPGPGGSQE